MSTSLNDTGTPQANTAAVPARHLTGGMALMLLAQLMFVLDTTIINVALPRIGTGLGFVPATLSWVVNGYALAFGGLLLLGGRLGDVLGRRRAFIIGVAFFTLASLAGGLAPAPGWLIAARAVQGAGAALAAPAVLALLTVSAPDEAARRRALALFSAVGVGGGTLGLVLGGVLTEYGSWRWTMFVNVPIGVVVLVLVPRLVNAVPGSPGRFDVLGAITATGAATGAVWALIQAPERGWTSPSVVGGLVAGAILLLVLIVTERRVEHPLLRPALLRDRRRVTGLIVSTLVFGGQMSIFFLVVQYLQRELDFTPLAAGLAFVPMTAGIFAMSRFTPRLVGRFGQTPLLVIGCLGLTASYAWLSAVGDTDGYATAVLGPLLLNGVAAGLTFMPAASLILGGIAPADAGAASGLMQTSQQLGGAVGLAVIVSVYAAGAVPEAFLPGARAAFLTAAGLTVLAVITVVALLVRRRTAPAA
ncbi:MFS transporter [Actinoplanes sp. NBRC 101535]|uniref:MFS transporter n=1 Tax=Actinoplanes sp. NBRC 101535 TaxID=3032196 RepID=UPI0024A2C310|nr:MFS transporter [Actinoplanes sp. NBRC 101535]GLY05460.1 MFS transporter [Actinoplanes sp. NBRC 101535]